MINIRSSRKKALELDLVPLINIVFLLLIFFMLTSNSASSSLKAELPEARSSNKILKKNPVMKISNLGEIELNGESISRKEIQGRLEQLTLKEKTKTLELQGDKSINFKLFGGVIGDARRAGVENFIFATQKPKPH